MQEKIKDDMISRQAAIDAVLDNIPHDEYWMEQVNRAIFSLPSAQPEIIRCKDCKWWDKFEDYDNGYCMAMKHGYWSGHWEISIRRIYKGDFYCADAEPKGEQECTI